MTSERTVKVFEVLHDVDAAGPAADGTVIARFRTEREATSFAAGRTCYGRPALAKCDTVPVRLARRWGVA